MSSKTNELTIFCDGACPGNGTPMARGAWAYAVWSGPLSSVLHDREPDVSCANFLPSDTNQTNQRAELTALLHSIQHAVLSNLPATIYSDSNYSIQCTNEWGPVWFQNNWTRPSKKKIENLDLIIPLVHLWLDPKRNWSLCHVPGHSTGRGPKAIGNNFVDRLATSLLKS